MDSKDGACFLCDIAGSGLWDSKPNATSRFTRVSRRAISILSPCWRNTFVMAVMKGEPFVEWRKAWKPKRIKYDMHDPLEYSIPNISMQSVNYSIKYCLLVCYRVNYEYCSFPTAQTSVLCLYFGQSARPVQQIFRRTKSVNFCIWHRNHPLLSVSMFLTLSYILYAEPESSCG